MIPSEIQGEDGALVIEKIVRSWRLCRAAVKPRTRRSPSTLLPCCAKRETFARLVETQDVDHSPGGEPDHRQPSSEIRRQTGVIFPADTSRWRKECSV